MLCYVSKLLWCSIVVDSFCQCLVLGGNLRGTTRGVYDICHRIIIISSIALRFGAALLSELFTPSMYNNTSYNSNKELEGTCLSNFGSLLSSLV